jgi:ribosomal protein S18 acetylase RimI-like enzyme
MVSIRRLESGDADAFSALRLGGLRESPSSFAASYEDEMRLTRDEFRIRVSPTDESWVLGAFDDASLMVGCIGWYRERGAKVAHKSHIWGMYVVPGHRRHGIARALVRELISRVEQLPGIRQIELSVAVGNPDAARLYEGEGFERVAILPNSLFVDGRYVDDQLFVRRVQGP